MQNQRNLLLAILLSMFVLFGYDYFFAPPIKPIEQNIDTTQSLEIKPIDTIKLPEKRERSELLQTETQLKIDSPTIEGSINLKGARFNNIVLKNYKQTIAEDSPDVVMFSPSGSHHPYFAAFSWVTNQSATMPDQNTLWTADKPTLKAGKVTTLSWTNPENITFQQIISLDEHYMFTVKQRVLNQSGEALTILPYAAITRQETPETSGYAILHEGPIGVINDTLKEYNYKDLQKKPQIEEISQGGWIGMTDKYWLASIIPDPASPYTARFTYNNVNQTPTYQADYRYEAMTVTADQTIEITNRLFVGPKLVNLLDHYEDTYHIARFDRAIDFGWFYFLTKPFFYAINFLYGLIGNFGLSILAFTVIIKLILFPLANKSYTAMSRMKLLQPKIVELKETYKSDPMTMNKKLMELYKTEKVNPMGGCLPILVQIPIFFALYKVLFVTIEARHAPFFGWIHDLSAPDPTTIFNLFGLLPFTPPGFLMIGAWPLIMGFTMYFQQKLNPAPQDPIQAKIFTALPIVFTFLLAKFPAGLVIYWAWNNSLSMLQQWVIMKKTQQKAGK